MDENKAFSEEEQTGEPREVVSWYVPRQAQEVVSCYVHSAPLPGAVSAYPAEETVSRKSRRWGLWISIGAVVLLLAAAVVGSILFSTPQEAVTDPDEKPSSIVDIFPEVGATTIPRYKEKTDYRMRLTQEIPAEELTPAEVFARVNPAVAMVVTDLGGNTGLGTGIIMTSDGYVLTNAHVVAGGRECCIFLDTGAEYDCELVGLDEERDLAVLHAIDAKNLPAAEFADSDNCWVGDTVYAIGNPLGVEFRCTLTNGILSGVERRLTIDGTEMTMLQTTAAVNNGNSGGPLINAYGQVIGIVTLKWGNTSGIANAATVEGIGLAIPTVNARYVVNALLTEGKCRGLPTLGITVRTGSADGTSVVVVQEVTEGYGGAKAGVQPGDVILSADGELISSTGDLLQARDLHVIGDVLALTVKRGAEVLTLDVPVQAP